MSVFPGAASLLEQVDQRLMVILRDGRHLVGTMRSFDQYSNIVLEDTVERHVVGHQYSDIELGFYIIRGENIVLLGDLDPEKEKNGLLQEVSSDEIFEADAINQEKGGESVREAWNFDKHH